MPLFGFLQRKEVGLQDYLRKTKRVVINGVRFEIKRITIEDHLAGLNVILKLHDLYKREKPDLAAAGEDAAKIRKFMRDFIFAGVVRPKLSMKNPPEEGAIHVDEVTADADLAQKLCVAILEHGYGKKN